MMNYSSRNLKIEFHYLLIRCVCVCMYIHTYIYIYIYVYVYIGRKVQLRILLHFTENNFKDRKKTSFNNPIFILLICRTKSDFNVFLKETLRISLKNHNQIIIHIYIVILKYIWVMFIYRWKLSWEYKFQLWKNRVRFQGIKNCFMLYLSMYIDSVPYVT